MGCCCSKPKTSKLDGDYELKPAASICLEIEDLSTQTNTAIPLPLVQKLNASINDVRSNDNNTVLVQFQEDVVAAASGSFELGPTTIGTVILFNNIKLFLYYLGNPSGF